MKISVKVKPNARQEKIEAAGENSFVAWVREKPLEGKATAAVIRALAEYLGVPRSAIVLVKGQTSKNKVFEIRS